MREESMRRYLMLAALVVALAAVIGCGGGDDAARTDETKTVADGPTDLTGQPFALAEYAGEVVVLDFWATWCGPCRMAMPHLEEIHKEYGDQGINVVAVATDRKGESVVRPFIEKNGYTFRVVPDDGSLSRAFGGIRSIPTTFVIGPDGEVVRQFVGYQAKDVYLNAALAAKGS